MPLEVNLNLLGDEFIDQARVTPDHRFLYPADTEITTGDLLSLVYHHQDMIRPMFETEYKYYVGKHPILDQPKKAPYKPDNRIIINFPRKAITSFNGFFAGTPVKIDHEDQHTDDWIRKWENRVNFEDVFSQVSKMSSMYGHAFFYVYQDDELDDDKKNQTLIAPLSPMSTFLIYDDTLSEKVRYGVMYRYNSEHRLEITLFEPNYKRVLVESKTMSGDLFEQQVSYANPYPMIPIIEAPENSERLALCQDVFNLVDAQNKAMSEKANTTDYFDDAYMMFKNAHVNPEDARGMQENRTIVVEGEQAATADVEFLAKPDADATEEHLIDRLVDYLYQMTNVTNLNDDAFGGDVTGVALQLKFQAMADMAHDKALKFRTALRDIFRCVLAVNVDVRGADIDELKFKFVQNIPHNLTEEANFLATAYGKLPTTLVYQQLSFIDDPEQAYKDLRAEQQEMADDTSNIMQQATQSKQVLPKDQKGGVNIADAGAGTKPDKPVNTSRQPTR